MSIVTLSIDVDRQVLECQQRDHVHARLLVDYDVADLVKALSNEDPLPDPIHVCLERTLFGTCPVAEEYGTDGCCCTEGDNNHF